MISSPAVIGVLSLLFVKSSAKSTVALRGSRRITARGSGSVPLGAIFGMMFQKGDFARARTMAFEEGETVSFLPNCDWADMVFSTTFGCNDCEEEDLGLCFDLSCSREGIFDMTWDCEACAWDDEDDENDATKLCGKSTCDMLEFECRDCEDLTWGGEDCASCDWCDGELDLTMNCTNIDLAAPYYECDGSWPETFWSADEDEDAEDEAEAEAEEAVENEAEAEEGVEQGYNNTPGIEDEDEDQDEDGGDEDDEVVEETEARCGN